VIRNPVVRGLLQTDPTRFCPLYHFRVLDTGHLPSFVSPRAVKHFRLELRPLYIYLVFFLIYYYILLGIFYSKTTRDNF